MQKTLYKSKNYKIVAVLENDGFTIYEFHKNIFGKDYSQGKEIARGFSADDLIPLKKQLNLFK